MPSMSHWVLKSIIATSCPEHQPAIISIAFSIACRFGVLLLISLAAACLAIGHGLSFAFQRCHGLPDTVTSITVIQLSARAVL